MSETETVLSELCSICHAAPRKYKCPRCQTRTCSVACIQKHKARADCDGIRDATAFKPISELRTAAGVDHDFNFMKSIELARQRTAKKLVEVRQILSEKELRTAADEKQFRKVWYGDELHHFPTAAEPHRKHRHSGVPPALDGFDKFVRRRLRFLDIEAISVPKGMARQKENTTSLNRRTNSINWRVEWMVYGAPGLPGPPSDQHQPTRILHKSLDGTPLNLALARTLKWYKGYLDRQSRPQVEEDDEEEEADSAGEDGMRKKKRRDQKRAVTRRKKIQEISFSDPTQDPNSSAWPSSNYTMQNSVTWEWSQMSNSSSASVAEEEEVAAFARWQFFLRKEDKAIAGAKVIIPISSVENLASALSGRTVVEFPTIHVLPPSASLPEGLALGGTERRKRKLKEVEKEEREESEDDKKSSDRPPAKKQAFERKDSERGPSRGRGRGRGRGGWGRGFERRPARSKTEAEDGEVNSDGDEVMADGDVNMEPLGVRKVDRDVNFRVHDANNSGGGEAMGVVNEQQSMEEEHDAPIKGGLVDYDSMGSD
ncbi:hypothetical protein B0H63DRAFT_470239 [Podospora didyma]|uniref:Box C/D snoRNA protein 1 n=1 Tax=Podospora didyma TaxID=330526 RepID=A0AAE0NTN4_9PEZI|nr:hypothetical protein B0H63DRAFT_470239 [Podospora didyma]